MADAADLKSVTLYRVCGFDSLPGHHYHPEGVRVEGERERGEDARERGGPAHHERQLPVALGAGRPGRRHVRRGGRGAAGELRRRA